MTIRTSSKSVTFRAPFTLAGVHEPLLAGVYTVVTDEKPLASMTFLAYQRIATWLHLPEKAAGAGIARVLAVDGNELDAALERDRAAARSGETAPESGQAQAIDGAKTKG
jgi:hypothetical protein